MIDYQCWICPKCNDDHSLRAECSPKNDKPFSPSPDDRSHIANEFRKLESRLAWAEGMLEGAKQAMSYNHKFGCSSGGEFELKWLADLEVGQKGEEEDNA